jgi:hypothetical protein
MVLRTMILSYCLRAARAQSGGVLVVGENGGPYKGAIQIRMTSRSSQGN